MKSVKSVDIPVFSELIFDEHNHIYKLNNDVLPSVTTIMKPLSQSLYKDVDESVLGKAASRGTAVHNAIECYVDFGIADIGEEYSGYFNAFKSWWVEFNPVCLASECRVYHKILRYAGTADMIVRIADELILVDFKTSSAVNKMLTGVQLEAYDKAFESHGIKLNGKAILHLKKDGKYTWNYYPKNDCESWSVFGALLTVHSHISKYTRR